MAARKNARKTATTRQRRKAPEFEVSANTHNVVPPQLVNSMTLDAIRGVGNKIDVIRDELSRISGRMAALRISTANTTAVPPSMGVTNAGVAQRPSTPVLDGIGELEYNLDRLHLELLAFDDSVVV